MRVENEESFGFDHLAYQYCVRKGSNSDYIRHVLFSLLKVLQNISWSTIFWLSTKKHHEMEGMIQGFPEWVVFVNGTKLKNFFPAEDEIQGIIYDGYQKLECFATFL